MKRTHLQNRNASISLFLCLFLVCGLLPCTGQQEKTGQDVKKLVFAGYPDGLEMTMVEVLNRLGEAYEKTHPNVRIELRPRLSYMASRQLVLEGKADGIMISERINRFRAYQSQTGGSRAFDTLKLNRFVPFATRILGGEKKVLKRMRLGIATDSISDGFQDFISFLSTEEAREALEEMRDMEITVPAKEPKKDRTGLKRGPEEVKLDTPILSY